MKFVSARASDKNLSMEMTPMPSSVLGPVRLEGARAWEPAPVTRLSSKLCIGREEEICRRVSIGMPIALREERHVR